MDLELGGIRFRRYDRGSGGRTVLWVTSKRVSGDGDELFLRLSESAISDFHLFVLYAEDWDRDLSPWRCECGGRIFGGCGRSVLEIIEGPLAQYCADIDIEPPSIIAGYSLAGLFAIWASYESQMFSGVCCCSGSLWFDGWDAYSEVAGYGSLTKVYLSLGGREPGSGGPPMSGIGDRYAEQRRRLQKDRNASVRFVSERGGHFSDPVGRLVRGISWLLDG